MATIPISTELDVLDHEYLQGLKTADLLHRHTVTPSGVGTTSVSCTGRYVI